MVSKKPWSFLSAVAMGLLAVAISIGLLNMSPALALERTGTESVRLAPPAQPESVHPTVILTFTFPILSNVQITDLAGNVIGEGEHGGKLRCTGNHCSQKTYLRFFDSPLTEPAVYEYKFRTGLEFDLDEERVTVAGRGKISSGGQKEGFSFTATFQNNGNGTVSVRYVASRPDASFIIPEQPARFEIRTR